MSMPNYDRLRLGPARHAASIVAISFAAAISALAALLEAYVR